MSVNSPFCLQNELKNNIGVNLPVLFVIVIACIANLANDLLAVTVLLAFVILMYVLILKVRIIDLYFLLSFFLAFFIVAQRFSLSLIFPLLAVNLAIKCRSISNVDYCFSVLAIVLVILLKIFFDLDDRIYLDRNHLCLISIMLLLISPDNINLTVKLFKLILFFSALLLLSRTFILFFIIFGFSFKLRGFTWLRSKLKMWHAFSYLLLATIISASISFAMNLDFFDSEVGNESSRLVEINDASNKARITALITFADYLVKEPVSAFLPVTIEDYQDVYGDVPTPHNTFFAIMFNYGLPMALAYLLYIGRLFERIVVSRYFFIIFTPYYLLLGGVLFGPTLMLFCIAARRFK